MSSTLEPEEVDIQVLDVPCAGENIARMSARANLQDFNSQNLKKRELVKASYVIKGEVGPQKDPKGAPLIMPLHFMMVLFVVWLLVGLVVFLKTGNWVLLVSAGVMLERMMNKCLSST